MIQAIQFRPGGTVNCHVAVDAIDRLVAQSDTLLWIDVTAPTAAELDRLQEELELHPLQMEDLTHRIDRPRVEQFEGMYAAVFYSAGISEAGQLDLRQINLIMTRHYLLTAHEQPVPELEEAIRRWGSNAELMEPDVGIPVYSLLDTLVDGYFPCIDQITERVEAMEEQIFGGISQGALESLFQLKKDLLQFRRVVAPERDVVNVLLRREQPVFSARSLIFFQDLYDHLVRITDSIDTYRDLLSSALDTYLTVSSNRLAENSIQLAQSANRLNQTMQVLAAWSIILMSGSLIAGIYGMNFRHMPELSTRNGYFIALGAILTLGMSLFAFFKRRKWL